MKKQTILTLAIILFIIVVAGISFALIYNGLVRAEKVVEEAKAQIEVVYQRKIDLIPNLVETVKGYAEHERQTFAAVAEARSKAQRVLEEIGTEKSLSKEKMAKLSVSQSELTSALKTLFALVENYPNLKASTNFSILQDQLEGTENRISVARQRYNSTLRLYNTKVATFPRNIVAAIFGFQENPDYFEVAEELKKTLEVKF
ncbi:MAG: LemA family protein [Planctomycetota bacterium]|jgi:LemA protein